MDIGYISLLALLIFGFGFVIFWHELGHFLAAKWAGVEVEQFAVGFGQALVSWRKGFGFKVGTSRQEYEKRLRDYLSEQEAALKMEPDFAKASSDKQRLDYASAKLGLSPTEYRLNWIPLGGYVKMLGQDDLDPASRSDSPNSYNMKPISKRMVIVSAGVIMNVILAIALFTLLFGIGFNAPRPVVGTVLTGSPAQQAGLKVGDKILEIDGWEQHDFTKIGPNVALAGEGEALDVLVERVDGTVDHLHVTPRRSDIESGGFLQMGVGPVAKLSGPDPDKVPAALKPLLVGQPVQPGESIIAINGTAVNPENYKDWLVLDQALQSGQDVTLTVEDRDGIRHDRKATPKFVPRFGNSPLNFAGMVPRTVVQSVMSYSSAKDKLQKGDIIDEVTISQNNDSVRHPSREQLVTLLDTAGQNRQQVNVTVIREGKRIAPIVGLDPSINIRQDRKGLGIALEADEDNAVVAQVLPDTAAATAGIPGGATITQIGDQPVKTWRDVHRALASAAAGQALSLSIVTDDGQSRNVNLSLTADQLAAERANHYTTDLALDESKFERKTGNPLVAAEWGVMETRDLMVQFYNMLRRMFEGSVSPKHAIGPVGIFDFGSKIANRGVDWVVWFLAMISANLAVVNFLPIPIVDGGLFVFLVLEKLMGRPLSARAQGIVQIVGLALIVCVFLFVTYHDITRLIY